MENKGRKALITGASSGIGADFARELAKSGSDLILVARREAALTQLAKELQHTYGVRTLVITADLSLDGSAMDLYDKVSALEWEVDILVNNAGFGDFGAFEAMERNRIEQMMMLNMNSLTILMRLFLPNMKAKGWGKVLNVASVAAFQPGPFMAVYFATKAYVLHLSEAVANELKGTGVTVTALCPGPTQSEFAKEAQMAESGLFSKNLPTAAAVAGYGFKQMMKGTVVAVHGFKNYVLSLGPRFVPRGISTQIARGINTAK